MTCHRRCFFTVTVVAATFRVICCENDANLIITRIVILLPETSGVTSECTSMSAPLGATVRGRPSIQIRVARGHVDWWQGTHDCLDNRCNSSRNCHDSYASMNKLPGIVHFRGWSLNTPEKVIARRTIGGSGTMFTKVFIYLVQYDASRARFPPSFAWLGTQSRIRPGLGLISRRTRFFLAII